MRLGILTTTTIVFTGLKLTGVINWSWLAVLSPFLGGLTLIFILFIICLIAVGLED